MKAISYHRSVFPAWLLGVLLLGTGERLHAETLALRGAAQRYSGFHVVLEDEAYDSKPSIERPGEIQVDVPFHPPRMEARVICSLKDGRTETLLLVAGDARPQSVEDLKPYPDPWWESPITAGAAVAGVVISLGLFLALLRAAGSGKTIKTNAFLALIPVFGWLYGLYILYPIISSRLPADKI